MNLTNINQLKIILKAHNMWAKKSLGQHFLIDEKALAKIIEASDISAEDTILEIGPGLGVLTRELLKHAGQVVAVEFDPKMAELLSSSISSKKIIVKNEHILKFNTAILPKNYKVVANLPYYITSPIIRNFLEAKNKPKSMTLLIQKEVAERIVSSPPNSVLAVAIQYYGKPEIVDIVPASSFWPAPKVDSAIINIDVNKKLPLIGKEKDFFRVVKAGFGERRKKLVNSLTGGLQISKEETIKILGESGIGIDARAEELSLDDWLSLYNIIRGET
ncbi:ribosomal RNA small subunit methyltransferase A [bacterium CG2_30_37_16]|nr:MAG: ribosomal RNA small subunit methyltransferase A [bacterium CG2_30_37_16]